MNKAIFLLVLLLSSTALADAPDRASLINAWEDTLRSLPSTTKLESTGENTYEFRDSEIDYAGELVVTGALIRPSDSYGFETEFTHFGMVEFELTDLPPERLASQLYYYWLSDRQTLHYSSKDGAWLNTSAYQQSLSPGEGLGISFGPLAFMMNYGIWILLTAVVLFVFLSLGKQQKKAKSLMDDSADINRMARENLERADAMQKELVAIARESQALQKQNNVLLERIASAVEKRS